MAFYAAIKIMQMKSTNHKDDMLCGKKQMVKSGLKLSQQRLTGSPEKKTRLTLRAYSYSCYCTYKTTNSITTAIKHKGSYKSKKR
jgi:hypothetical protein